MENKIAESIARELWNAAARRSPPGSTMTDLSPSQAAARLGVGGECVRWYCRKGLIGRRVLGRWRIAETEVERLLAGGRPSPSRDEVLAGVEATLDAIDSVGLTVVEKEDGR